MFEKLKSIFTREAANTIRAELRFSNKTDVDDLLHFYRGNRHQHVHIRDEKLLSNLVRDGKFLILKDKKTGEILASSGTYPYKVKNDTDRASYMEIGSTRFSDKVAGFGLYPLFISSQVVHATLTDPCKSMFIANVYDDSPVGRSLLTKKAGWKVVEATKDILDVFLSTKDKDAAKGKADARTMTWYGSPPSCMPHQAAVVLDFIHHKKRIAHKNNGFELHIDYKPFDLNKRFKKHLWHMAQMQDSDLLQDDTGSKRALDVPAFAEHVKRQVEHEYLMMSYLRPPY